jgi:hypothetical protein
MDPIRSLRTLVAGGLSSATEGKVESRDERKGTVVVRLPGNETVVAQGSGLQPGDRVVVAKSAEGVWIARPLARPEGQAAPVLSSWLTEPPGSDLGEALRSGEPRQIRTALVALWRQLDSKTAAQDLPPALQEARRRGMPPLVSRTDASVRTVPTPSAVPLALRAETSPGVYRGEIPGRRFELMGPPGIRLGEAGLWTESVLSEILSVWLPTAVEDGAVPGLPARVTADASGARRLLDHLGVELSQEDAESPSFGALVRSLARAGSLFLGEEPREAHAVPTRSPGPPFAGTPTPAADPASVVPPRQAPSFAAPAATAPQRDLELERMSLGSNPSDLLDPLEVLPRSGASQASSLSVRPEAGRSAPNLPIEAQVSDGAPGMLETAEIPAKEASFPVAVPHPAVEASVPLVGPLAANVPKAGLPVAEGSARPTETAVRELPSAVALRVVLAWLVAPQEPSEALLRAAVGGFRDLPEALQILARAQDLRPEDFEAVAAFLKQASPDEPLLPRDLGLDRRPSASPGAQDPLVARPLSQAIVEDLAKALAQGRGDDAAVLREALGSLVGEALDRARDPANPTASAPWTMPPNGERPDSGRVVVRDRRKSHDAPSEKTVVEVSMNPTGLGSVDARLELRGDDLDVVFHAREASTVERIREQLPELRGILTQLGLQPKELESRAGRPGVAKRSSEVRESSGGLDIRA